MRRNQLSDLDLAVEQAGDPGLILLHADEDQTIGIFLLNTRPVWVFFQHDALPDDDLLKRVGAPSERIIPVGFVATVFLKEVLGGDDERVEEETRNIGG